MGQSLDLLEESNGGVGEEKQMGSDCCGGRGGISRIQGAGGGESLGKGSNMSRRAEFAKDKRTLWHEATALGERHDK